MQDDVAMERGIEIARSTEQPFWTLHPNGWMYDETGRYPARWAGPKHVLEISYTKPETHHPHPFIHRGTKR